MLNNKSKKALIMLATVFVASSMLLTSFASVPGIVNDKSGTYSYSPSISTPPYNVTIQEKGFPLQGGSTSWALYSNYFGYQYSYTNYINLTNVYNGSYYFSVYSYTSATNSYTPNPATFTLIVSGSSVFETVQFANTTLPGSSSTYQLNLSITNMPNLIPGSPQWNWNVYISGVNVLYSGSYTSYSPVFSISGFANGTYNYRITEVNATYSYSNIYGTTITPPTGQFTVSGKNVNLHFKINFKKQYSLAFSENGLPTAQSFTVYLYSDSMGFGINSQAYVLSTHDVNFKVLNGTYYYTIYAGSNAYRASPFDGTITVSGKSVTVNVAFSLSTPTYSVLFSIANLPTNQKGVYWYWEIYLNGSYHESTNSTLAVAGLANGTYFYELYGYGITFTSSVGSFNVAGKAVRINVDTQSSYTVTFRLNNLTEFATGPPEITTVVTNLATGYSISLSSYNGTIIIPGMINGTYQYYITVPPPYSLNQTTGTFTVNGKDRTIGFSGKEGSMYLVQFRETGIPLWGTSWGVVIDNGFTYNNSYSASYLSNVNSPLPYLAGLPNGTYDVQGFIYSNGQYHFTAPQTVKVSGGALNVTLAFSSGPSSGSVFNNNIILLGAIIAAIVVIAGATAYFVRKKRGGEGGS